MGKQETVQVGTIIRTPQGRLGRVVALVDIFGIPAADFVLVRQNGQDDHRSFKRHNLPLSVLDVVKP